MSHMDGKTTTRFGCATAFLPLLAFLPVIFMVAALPITVARLRTTQAGGAVGP
jgi:hypothetical protein